MKLFRQEHFGGQAGREHELRRRLLDRLDRDPRLQRKDAKVAEDAKRFLIFVRCGSEENRQATAAAGWQALAIRVWIRFKARFALKFRRAPEPHKISNLPAPSLRSAFDKLSASGCHTPGCNHKGHDHPFFFSRSVSSALADVGELSGRRHNHRVRRMPAGNRAGESCC